ncbi:MAG: LPXTG cell wall anchor domain-containing protein [Clostridium sp.]|jgi:LPXTG-motif cell wall-anchored protein|nr:LPXTG cell wall anchor domain-containing protein [Clostridium sp.]
MKKVLALVLAVSMLLTFGMLAFAEEELLSDEELALLDDWNTTTEAASTDGLNPDVFAILDGAFSDDILSQAGELFGGMDVDSLMSVLTDTFATMSSGDMSSMLSGFDISSITEMFDIGSLSGGGDVMSGFVDTLGGMMGIDLNSYMADTEIFSFFSKLYTGVYTGGGTATTTTAAPTTTAPTIDTPTDTGDIPDTGVDMVLPLSALAVLIVAVGAAFVLRKKKTVA